MKKRKAGFFCCSNLIHEFAERCTHSLEHAEEKLGVRLTQLTRPIADSSLFTFAHPLIAVSDQLTMRV